MANKIKYGIQNCYYAVITQGQGGTVTYGTPVALPGAVNLTLSAEGESTPFYADNIVYFQTEANAGYSGTLELALIPESFRKDVLGEVEGQNGILYENADVVAKEFALLFQFEGDEHAVRHAMYRCSAGRPDVNGATKEASIEPQTETLNITCMPRLDDHIVKGSCPATETTTYNGWFTQVTLPTV